MIFPKVQKAAGGLLDRINQASQEPTFGLGIGFLQGSPQQGFQNANMLHQQERQRSAMESAAKVKALEAQARERQRAFEQMARMAQLKISQQNANTGTDRLAFDKSLHNALFGPAPTDSPSEGNPVVPPMDVIDGATGPIDGAKAILHSIPAFAGLFPGVGADQAAAQKALEGLKNDLRSAFAVNTGRLSNYQLQLTDKLVPKGGFFKSEESLVTTLGEVRRQLDHDMEVAFENTRNPGLSKSDRSKAHIALSRMQSVAERIDGIHAAHNEATRLKGAQSVPNLGAIKWKEVGQ